MYINSLQYVRLKGEATIYADDTCFIYHGQNKHALEPEMNEDLTKYLQWLSGNKILINTTKPNYIFNPTKKPEIQLLVKLNSIPLQRANSFKYLGVTLDDKLDWKMHIQMIRKKGFPIVGALRRCTHFDQKTAKLVSMDI